MLHNINLLFNSCALNSELLSVFDTKKILTNINSSKASSDSQQPSPNNENPETHTEPALSQGVDGKTTFKPKDHLGNISEEDCALNSELLSVFDTKKILTNINSSKASSDSQQPSPNNENPETHPETQGAYGKNTFKPKDLLSNILEEESQDWTISEMDGTAELLEGCWLDVTGSMPATKGKAYEISFILSMNEKNSFGWEDPVYVMARIGEEGEYTRVQIDLSKLKGEVVEFPPDKCRVEPRGISSESDEKSESKAREKKSQTNKKGAENAKNDKEMLYFGLYEVWTNNWKGGLRVHEAIVQEIPAGINDPPPNTPSDDSKVQEVITADKFTSASGNPPPDMSIIKKVPDPLDEFVAQKTSVHDSASTSTKHVGDDNGCRIS
uniref:Uncharacterized protein n=1 Tax=Populus alba TaxID=43335 RepID=A0A4U5Q0A1_POPAL|nr:hypothetical protein D5086_0000173750 [Populus alba]